MKKTEAKKILFYQLKPFFINMGFKLVAAKFSGFIKQLDTGFDWVYFDVDDYNPCQNIYYSVMKRIESIDKIWQQVDMKYFNTQRLNIEYAHTLKFSYETINNLNKTKYLPDVFEEKDVQINTDLILDFMGNTALPLLDRFNDLREIDKEINGKDFWESDWRKPFILGGAAFPYVRTIIAHLCSNANIKGIKKYHIDYWNENLHEYPDCQKSIDAYSYLIELLKNVKPMY